MNRRFPGYLAAALFAFPAAALADEIRVPQDHRHLQDALDAAQPGDTVVVRGRHRGPFYLDAPDVVLVAERGAKLRGVPHRRRSSEDDGKALVVNADRVTVRGFRFVNGAFEANGNDVVLEDSDFRRVGGHMTSRTVGIEGDGAVVRNNAVRGSRRSHPSLDIAVKGDGGVIEGNRLDRPGGQVAVVISGDDGRIAGNGITRVERATGILVHGDGVVVGDNLLEGSSGSRGAVVVFGERARISGNGIRWTEARRTSVIAVTGSDGTVEDNDVTMWSGTGIRVRGERTIVAGNRVEGFEPKDPTEWARGHGIAIRGSGNVVEGNEVTGVPGEGIRIAGGTSNGVDRCTVSGAATCGIGNWTPGTDVTGSVFLGNGTDVVNGGTFGTFTGNDYGTGCPDDESVPGADGDNPRLDDGMGAGSFTGGFSD